MTDALDKISRAPAPSSGESGSRNSYLKRDEKWKKKKIEEENDTVEISEEAKEKLRRGGVSYRSQLLELNKSK